MVCFKAREHFQNSVSFFYLREQVYKHRCVSVYLCMYLSFCPSQIFPRVNETSTEARLVPGSCTVEYKQVYMCTLSVHCTVLFSLAQIHLAEFYNSRNSCSRIVLVCPLRIGVFMKLIFRINETNSNTSIY